jgi:hypothetical protein
MLFVFSSYLSAQELVVGGGFAVGVGWEIERLPINAPPTENTGIAGDQGYELYGLIGYRIDRFTLGIRPSFLVQQTTAYRLMGDDGTMSFREQVYPIAMLLPLRMEITFGEQRFRPLLGLGGGFLLDLNDNDGRLGPQPAGVLPFVEVAVGVDVRLRKWHLRPEVNIRNGTGELFHAGLNPTDQAFSGHRWGYTNIGVIISR